ncbi:MAG: hypothetical protein HY291_02140 [Planctomycetes bacterium]|nr:hypothetical protein [Planctomycetota bacterium]
MIATASQCVYQITNWDQFENNKSRELGALKWFLVPNEGTTKLNLLLSMPDGAAIYGLHHLLLALVSRQKQTKEVRRNGWLTHNGTESGDPFTVEELAGLVNRPFKEVQRGLEVLTSNKIGWVKRHLTGSQPAGDGQQVPAACPRNGQRPGRRAAISGHGAARPSTTEVEVEVEVENRIKENGSEATAVLTAVTAAPAAPFSEAASKSNDNDNGDGAEREDFDLCAPFESSPQPVNAEVA